MAPGQKQVQPRFSSSDQHINTGPCRRKYATTAIPQQPTVQSLLCFAALHSRAEHTRRARSSPRRAHPCAAHVGRAFTRAHQSSRRTTSRPRRLTAGGPPSWIMKNAFRTAARRAARRNGRNGHRHAGVRAARRQRSLRLAGRRRFGSAKLRSAARTACPTRSSPPRSFRPSGR